MNRLYSSLFTSSHKQKYDDAVLGTITHPHLRAYSMKMESLYTSLPWTLRPNKSMMMQSLGPSLTLIEGILNEDGESLYESPLDTSAKQKYDDAVLGTITHPH